MALRQTLTEAQCRITELTSESEAHTIELTELSSRLAARVQELEECHACVSLKELEENRLAARVQELEVDVDRRQGLEEALQLQLQLQVASFSSSSSQLQTVMMEKGEIEQKLRNLQLQYSCEEYQIAALSEQLNDSDDHVVQLSETNKTLRDRLKQLQLYHHTVHGILLLLSVAVLVFVGSTMAP